MYNKEETILHCNEDKARKYTLAIVAIGDIYKLGYSILNPIDKNYAKKLGRTKAIGKARSKDGIFVPLQPIEALGGTIKAIIAIKNNIDKNLDLEKRKISLNVFVENIKKSLVETLF